MTISNIFRMITVWFFVTLLSACGGNEGADTTDSTGPDQMEEMNTAQEMSGTGQMSGMDDRNTMTDMNEPAALEDMPGMEMGSMGQMSGTGGMSSTDMEAAAAAIAALGEPRTSNQGLYRVMVTSEIDPVVINRIHSWTVHLETVEGDPVDNAEISVSGGMPVHAHGLPTAPEVTGILGNGNYLVEGMNFQMPGHWQVTFDITAENRTDSATLHFVLE